MSDWLPSLNALRAFDTVSRHLNYRQAADELNVSPAAVKQLVHKLEDTLETKLLERRGRGLVLTPAGQAASRDLSKAFMQISEAVGNMRSRHFGPRLVVSVDPSFAAAWLVPRLAVFKAKFPDIGVLIDSTAEIADLDRGDADVAIRFGVEIDRDLYAHRLFDEELCAYCSPSLVKGPPRISQLEDLEKAPLLRWDLSEFQWAATTAKWNKWHYWLAQVGAARIEPKEGIRFSDYNIAVQAAIAGQGFIIGSTPVLRRLIDANLLVNPFPEVAATDIGYDLVSTTQSRSRPEVKTFMDWIIEESELQT